MHLKRWHGYKAVLFIYDCHLDDRRGSMCATMKNIVRLASIGYDILSCTIANWKIYSALLPSVSISPGFEPTSTRLLEFDLIVPALVLIASSARSKPFYQNLLGNGWLGYDGSTT